MDLFHAKSMTFNTKSSLEKNISFVSHELTNASMPLDPPLVQNCKTRYVSRMRDPMGIHGAILLKSPKCS